MATRARELAAQLPPGDAFFIFFAETTERGMVNLALGDELTAAGVDLGPAGDHAATTFLGMIDTLLRAAQATRDVRPDINALDVRALLVAVISATASMHLDDHARAQLMKVVTDGMQPESSRS